MARSLVVILVLVFASPAFAKPHNNIYTVPCSDLWNAVMDTLGDKGNYSIMASDDTEMTASFIVVGAVRVRVNSVTLNPQDNGCELKLKVADSGYSNSNEDEATFRKRVDHSMTRLKATSPAPPAKPAGQE